MSDIVKVTHKFPIEVTSFEMVGLYLGRNKSPIAACREAIETCERMTEQLKVYKRRLVDELEAKTAAACDCGIHDGD